MKHRVLSAALLVGFAGLASAQTAPAAKPATLDDVVAEVRALRADMLKMQEASVRAQLLVARLQVEEQRIASLTRELTQADQEIRGYEAAHNPFTESMLKELTKAQPDNPEAAPFVAMLKGQLENLQSGSDAAKARQASLNQLLADEQARWTSFNAQLEALERELPVVKKK
jgi:chromosome segregation ATPase